jgi:hypothetical protein
MRYSMLLAVGFGCVACSSSGGASGPDGSANRGDRDASVNSGGHSGVAGSATTTGGNAGRTAETAAGGSSGTPRSTAADGVGTGGTGGVTSTGGSSGRLRDAGNDAADASSAEGDGSIAACARHHQSPAGRYTLRLHSMVQYAQFTAWPDCAVVADAAGDAVIDRVVTATLDLHEDSASTFDSKTNKIYPAFVVYGTLHAAGADLTAPADPYDVHSESYGDYPGETPFLQPFWLSADAGVTNPSPFRVSTVTPGSDIPACWGMVGCATPLDEVVITFDTTTWTVQFSRSFHHYGMCGAVFTSTQTGTGHLDCGDE